MNRMRALFAVVVALLLLASWACTREVVKEVPVEVVVEKEVVKEVMVPGETIVVEKEVVKEVSVEVVVEKEVVKEVMVPGETIVVEKEVVKEVMVPGETVVVEKEVVKTVEVPVERVVEKEVVKVVEVEKEVVRIVEVERDEEKVLNIRMSSMPPSFPPHTTGSGAVVQVMGYMFPRLAQPDPTTREVGPGPGREVGRRPRWQQMDLLPSQERGVERRNADYRRGRQGILRVVPPPRGRVVDARDVQ